MFYKKANVHLDWIISFMIFFMFLVYAVTFFLPNILKDNTEEVTYTDRLNEFISEIVYLQDIFISDMIKSNFVFVDSDVLNMGDYSLVEDENINDYFYYDDLLFIKKSVAIKNKLIRIKNSLYNYSNDNSYDVYSGVDNISNNNWEIESDNENLSIDFGSDILSISYKDIIDEVYVGTKRFIGYLYLNTSNNEYKYYISDENFIKSLLTFNEGGSAVFKKQTLTYLYDDIPDSVIINNINVSTNYTFENQSVTNFIITIDGITHIIGEKQDVDLLDVEFVYENDYFYYIVELQQLTGGQIVESFSEDNDKGSDYDFLNRGFITTQESVYKTASNFANINYEYVKEEIGSDFSMIIWQGGLTDSFNLSNSPYYKYNINNIKTQTDSYNDRYVMQHIDKYANKEPITIYTIIW